MSLDMVTPPSAYSFWRLTTMPTHAGGGVNTEEVGTPPPPLQQQPSPT